MAKDTICEECSNDLSEDGTCSNCDPVAGEKENSEKDLLEEKEEVE
ncbi:MAG: hypothetical protein AAB514_00055 [Patescibacteria group bacterium]